MNEGTCCVDQCERLVRTRGMCNAHYLRSRKYGDPTMGGPLKTYWRGATCTSSGCVRKIRRKGLCASHYSMLLVYGRSEAITAEDRFWRKVGENEEGCWLWTGALNLSGYGNFYWQSREGGSVSNPYVAAHRYAYQVLRAEIPAGLHLDHMCRVTACVNPWHLEPVSPAENQRRAVMLGGLTGQNSIRFLEEYQELRARIRAAA